MKKLIMAAMLGLATTGYAQKEGSLISLGVKAGFNSTKFKLSDIGTYDKEEWKTETKNGFIYGAYARIKLSHPFYIQPELYFSEKKFEAEGKKISAKTFDIPILANMRLITVGPVRVHAIAGPVMSIVRKEHIPAKYEDYIDYKSKTWTFQAGAGVEVMGIGLDARYEWGFNEATRGIGGKTDVLTITAGFRLFGH